MRRDTEACLAAYTLQESNETNAATFFIGGRKKVKEPNTPLGRLFRKTKIRRKELAAELNVTNTAISNALRGVEGFNALRQRIEDYIDKRGTLS